MLLIDLVCTWGPRGLEYWARARYWRWRRHGKPAHFTLKLPPDAIQSPNPSDPHVLLHNAVFARVPCQRQLTVELTPELVREANPDLDPATQPAEALERIRDYLTSYAQLRRGPELLWSCHGAAQGIGMYGVLIELFQRGGPITVRVLSPLRWRFDLVRRQCTGWQPVRRPAPTKI
jgi:hypothetical protein